MPERRKNSKPGNYRPGYKYRITGADTVDICSCGDPFCKGGWDCGIARFNFSASPYGRRFV